MTFFYLFLGAGALIAIFCALAGWNGGFRDDDRGWGDDGNWDDD